MIIFPLSAKPIDLLAWYVSSEHLAEALEMHEPYTYLHGLRAPDLSDLLEDIKVCGEGGKSVGGCSEDRNR
ncbi:hypothetical protein JYU34_014824 [Plutella xylostella]|uniref:Splicing factor cactin central domain-containing protein n=1 Tax=Plutella xylostella TaxID=51655 RepID=A0ABQ7Q989_PLUXY|nr:hypothetical protein JYU34_014824 [Plutella xylostella]